MVTRVHPEESRDGLCRIGVRKSNGQALLNLVSRNRGSHLRVREKCSGICAFARCVAVMEDGFGSGRDSRLVKLADFAKFVPDWLIK